jgi:hypothetical protein
MSSTWTVTDQHARFLADAVGESFHMDTLTRMVRFAPAGSVSLELPKVGLVPEPENPYDSNAVIIVLDGQLPAGHLPRALAAEWAPILRAACADIVTTGRLIWHPGTGRSLVGVQVWLPCDPLDFATQSGFDLTGPRWLPDPVHRHEYRYWDGGHWTAKVADGDLQGIDPINKTGGHRV